MPSFIPAIEAVDLPDDDLGPGQVTIITSSKDCAVCRDGSPAKYDARTFLGSWGNLCPECFVIYGFGVGVGHGQRLIVRE